MCASLPALVRPPSAYGISPQRGEKIGTDGILPAREGGTLGVVTTGV